MDQFIHDNKKGNWLVLQHRKTDEPDSKSSLSIITNRAGLSSHGWQPILDKDNPFIKKPGGLSASNSTP